MTDLWDVTVAPKITDVAYSSPLCSGYFEEESFHQQSLRWDQIHSPNKSSLNDPENASWSWLARRLSFPKHPFWSLDCLRVEIRHTSVS